MSSSAAAPTVSDQVSDQVSALSDQVSDQVSAVSDSVSASFDAILEYVYPSPPAPPPLTFQYDMASIIGASLLVALAYSLLHLGLAAAVPRLSPRIAALTPDVRAEFLSQLLWLIGCSPLPFMYASALPSLYGSVYARWHGTEPIMEWAMLLHVGSSLYEVAVYAIYGKPWLYSVHHAVAVYAYILGLWVGKLHFWVRALHTVPPCEHHCVYLASTRAPLRHTAPHTAPRRDALLLHAPLRTPTGCVGRPGRNYQHQRGYPKDWHRPATRAWL